MDAFLDPVNVAASASEDLYSPLLSSHINYSVEEGTEGSVEHVFPTKIKDNKSLKIKGFPVTINNIRSAVRDGVHFDVEENGFEVLTDPYPALDSAPGWEEAYTAHVSELLRKRLGATQVVAYNFQIRRRYADDDPRKPAGFDENKLEPATVAHVDGAQYEAPGKAAARLGIDLEEVTSRKKHVAIINIWRPLLGPVIDSPLLVCDSRTTSEDDIELTTDIYGGGSYIKHSDAHKWYYLKDQTPSEILLLRCFDSEKGPNDGGITPHTAIIDTSRDRPGLRLRQSIEVRCCVEY